MSWAELTAAGRTRQSPSSLEAERFGVSVDRVVVPLDTEDTDDDVCGVVAASGADVVVLRYPTERVRLGSALLSTGRVVLPADVLVYWRSRLAGIVPPEVQGLVSSVEPGVDEELSHLVAEVFADYSNHYAANPLFGRELALEGYVDWARRSLAGTEPVLTRLDGEVVAFATLASGDDHLEVELAGVHPRMQGRGVYAHLMAEVEDVARRSDMGRLVISTQLHNTRVQRAWARFGWQPVSAFTTVHVVRGGLLVPVGE